MTAMRAYSVMPERLIACTRKHGDCTMYHWRGRYEYLLWHVRTLSVMEVVKPAPTRGYNPSANVWNPTATK
jgi:hypothetical protein